MLTIALWSFAASIVLMGAAVAADIALPRGAAFDQLINDAMSSGLFGAVASALVIVGAWVFGG